ncbi:MAG: PH domain-containing protein [Fuerstiella sp.]|nr:PH domain-containing protein [Fuerstiella sp.]
MTEHPSIAAGMPGQALGTFYDCIPVRVFGLTVSHLLFALPTAPLAIGLYALQRLAGESFVLTNRSLQIWAARSGRCVSSVDLSQVADAEVTQAPGQKFFKAGDILVRNASGEIIQRLRGVPDALSFSNAIQRTAESRRLVQSAMETIEARG